MWFFGKKKQNKTSKLDEAFSRVYRGISRIDSWADPKKLERYILDSCEQIIATTKEMERQKAEYRVVTAYLTDIKTISELPPEQGNELKETATNIVELDKTLTNLSHVKRNITDEQRLVIMEDEPEMPDIINRMADSEKYQDTVKKEMRTLEGEKGRWEIEHDQLIQRKRVLKNLIMGVTVVFISLFILLVVVGKAVNYDMRLPYLIVLAVAAFLGLYIYLEQTKVEKDSQRALSYLNQTIGMLNVSRMKYVNVTNGIDYTKEKYHVQSSAELMYVWEQYIEAVKDKERYIRGNDDLERLMVRLERILNKLDIHDKNIWMTRINALVNPEDMREVRHRLVVRRQQIRQLIDENRNVIQNERDEIDRLMREHKHYLPEIQEIIESVDKLCGTAPKLEKTN